MNISIYQSTSLVFCFVICFACYRNYVYNLFSDMCIHVFPCSLYVLLKLATFKVLIELEMTSDARRESMLRKTLQVCITMDTQTIQSFDWHKWWTLWRNVNSCVFVGLWTSFQAVCQYVNCISLLTYMYAFLGRVY